MNSLVLVLAVVVLSAGCNRDTSSSSYTSFFSSHDAQKQLESLAAKEGLTVGGGGSSLSLGGPTGEKDFQVEIGGDGSSRDRLLKLYKAAVEREIKTSGATINGRGETGDIRGFDFNYNQSGRTGILRVTSMTDSAGHFEIDVFLYEH